ncbi:MAG TPA: DEAD/DEAH box helicase [Ferrovibrio sp.]|uniref:DEAD/DEAH box helicase n=1 Tax=Ferrovibrio sp. TaxID=1917215 RepID=UPI002B4AE048|nr:DEAD/DEAH box helicase [Ferrovibrio sp.]HLT79069.1 DEAD/DEAH box helicase [Ferrovibrio sp.]
MTAFKDLGLSQPLLNALALGKYTQPTPIQSQAIPPVLAGRDLLGIAQTGTGKTAAFALPILHRLGENNRRPAPKTCRVLVLSPTRELASQIADKFRSYGRELKLTTATVFGGVGMHPQIQMLARGVDILVATPGRLIDHLQQNTLRLDRVEVVVFDEADQMLDMGFMPAVKRIAALLPKQRQSLFFSATMPQNIAQLAAGFLKDPIKVEVTPVATTAERVEQQIIFVETERKRALLAEIMKDPAITRALVFTRTKHGADRVARHLTGGGVPANAIHGNKSQNQRERALADFKSGRIRVLVATDIAARGIDVTGVSHVINFELPNVPESYVHRIGRTARAGAAGQAISLCAQDERPYLRDIERTTRQRIPAIDRRGDAALATASAAEPKDVRPPREPQNHHRGQRSEGQRGDGHRNGQPQQARNGKPGNRRFGKPRNQRQGQNHSYGNPGRSQAQAG